MASLLKQAAPGLRLKWRSIETIEPSTASLWRRIHQDRATVKTGSAGIEVRRWRRRGVRRQAHVFSTIYRLRQEEWLDQTLDQAFGLPEVLVAVSTSRLSCKRAGKTRTLMPVWDSSGESRLKDVGRSLGLLPLRKARSHKC